MPGAAQLMLWQGSYRRALESPWRIVAEEMLGIFGKTYEALLWIYRTTRTLDGSCGVVV
jgi:hypothetical protein